MYKILREQIDKLFDKFFYVKLCYTRAYAYAGIPIAIGRDFLLISVYLKVSLGIDNKYLLIGLFAAVLSLALIGGHGDIKYKFAHQEHTVWNQVNPQLMKILENTKQEGKKSENNIDKIV